MGAHNVSRTSWRAARNIRRIAELAVHEMQPIARLFAQDLCAMQGFFFA